MDKHFKVIINNSQDFNFSQKQATSLNTVQKSSKKHHILQKNKSYKAELVQSNFDKKQYTIAINSNTYDVKIENSLDGLIKKMGYSTGSSKKMNFIKAPMPGIIIGWKVKEGDIVKEGDTLLILEAMKMENAISCPKDATVKSVHAKKGDTVEKNKLLIELE